MGYQTGTVGPIVYNQDNSGDNTDTDTPVNYKPDQFGAPPGAQIIAGLTAITKSVHRGEAYVHNEINDAEGISFMVYTQAANDGLFGWHSGSITVSTTFQWYCITDNNVLKGGDAFFTKEPPAVLPNATT
jgi:hypothetical protein